MEMVEGASLAAVLRNGRLELEAALSYAGQVLAALSYAHGRGVVHRDIKPANIIVMPNGVVKVTDFGIARAGGSERLTMTGMALGSLYYMSPEQIQGGVPDARSDLYSLGVTLYEMVTGVPPFRGDNEYAIMHAHLTGEAAPPAELAPGLPPAIAAVILRAMAKSPDGRFHSADEFRAALRPPGEATPKPFPAPMVSAAMAIAGPSALDPEQVTRIETHLVRALGPIARHLVSQASRRAANIEELCRELAEKVADPREREAFLRSCGKGPAGEPNTTGARTGPGKLTDDRLNEAKRKLAPFVGPLAKVLVDRAARKARTAQEFYSALAAEIPSERERAAFLSSLGV